MKIRGLAALVVLAALGLGGAVSAQAPEWPSEGPPRPLAARDSKFPPYQIQTLPNGLQVVAVLHHEQPAVSLRMLVRAGSALDPKGKLGVARLVASLLDQGTKTKSAQEMNDEIDFIGGAMGAGAGTDLSFVNMVVMKDSFEVGLRMMSDLVERPAFSPEEIERQRQQTLSGLKVNLEDPEYVATAVFDRLVYGFHPYGLPDNGTPGTLAGITRDDLVAFHNKYFVPNNAILAIVGDVTAPEAFDTARKVFGDWKSRDVPREKFIDPPNPTRRVVVVDKPDSVQTEIRVGHLGIPRNHPDFMALNLAIRILGGEGSNRLHQVLRTQRALTYGAKADMNTLKDSGDFEAETNTRTEATGEVLRLIVDEFWRLQRERVSERELADAQAYMAGSFPLTIETPDAIAMQVLNALFFGLPLEQLQSFRERVNAVTVDDIERVARYYLQPERVSVVLVGNAAAFTPQLGSVGFGRYETIKIENLDLTTVDFKQAPRVGEVGESAGIVLASFQERPSSAPLAAEGSKADALLGRVIAAKGGLAALRAIKSIRAVTAATMNAPTGNVEAETTTYLQYPDHVRVETKLPQGQQVQVYDGVHAWIRDPAGVHDLPDRALRDIEASLKRDTVAALLAADRGELRARVLPDVKDASGAFRHALELSSPGLEPIVLQIDPDTGLIVKLTYVIAAPGQPLIEELFSDYRAVDGVQIAFAAAVRRGGHPLLERRVTRIAINPPLDPALFKRPAS
jgi:zinc protease